MKKLTPSDLEVLIHCHTSPRQHPRVTAPAIQEALSFWLSHEAIEVVDRPVDTADTGTQVPIYSTTAKGRKWLQMMLETPEPVREWHDPREEKV